MATGKCILCGAAHDRPSPAAYCWPCARGREASKRAVVDSLRRALKSGELERPQRCGRCGQTPREALHGHHADYSKPLAVEWLCRSCHFREHHRLRVAAKGLRVPVSA
jgi:hypothetical protein